MSLLKNSLWVTTTRLFASGANFLSFIILARVLGPEEFGRYSEAFSLSMLLALVMSFGLQTFILKYVPMSKTNGDLSKESAIYIFSLLMYILVSVLIIGFFYILYRESFEVVYGLAIVSMAICYSAFHVGFGFLRVFEKLLFALTLRDLVWRCLIIVFCGVLWFLSYTIDHRNMLFMSSILLACILPFYLYPIFDYFKKNLSTISFVIDWRCWSLACLGFCTVSLVGVGDSFIFVFLVGQFFEEALVGAFFSAIKIAELINLIFFSIVLTFSKKISESLSNNNFHQLQKFINQSNLIVTVPVCFLGVGIFIFSESLLALFDRSYAESFQVLQLLSVVVVLNALFGPNMMIMQLFGFQWLLVIIQIFSLCAGAISLYLTEANLGLIAAALSYAISKLLCNLLVTLFIFFKFNINTSLLGVLQHDLWFKRHV